MQSALTERDIRPAATAMPLLSRKSAEDHDRQRAGQDRLPRSPSGARAPRSPPRRKCASGCSTTSWAPSANSVACAGAARRRPLRRGLRPSACLRHLAVPVPTPTRSSAPTGCCGRRRAAVTGGFYSSDEFELDSAGRPPPGPAFPRARPLLRPAGIPLEAHHRGAVARHLGLYQPLRDRRDDRLRLVPRHRAGARTPRRCPISPIIAAPNPTWDVRAVAGALLRRWI